ncbi:ATP-binding cassette domain-containing protein [Tissierella creatinophila]|uniref:Putative ABC transporter ATP-binding protein n=1 Tax=Tissierella creatinophila DSM 6911 TaxID=1123403 RepID=A0A1U7M4I6_TISCR|nr:ABC transporter ATP-binding protein [Tissierella creatinophila]OLS02195.1 putative ABC transporter ATP-binding protein [Tissierella creatinophila DSM 6911]
MGKIKEVINFLKPYIKLYKCKFLKILLISIILSILQSVPVKLSQLVLDIGFLEFNFKVILILSFCILLINVVKSFVSFMLNKETLVAGQSIIKMIRSDVFRKILNSPLIVLTEKDSSYLVQRVGEVNNIAQVFSPSFFSVTNSILDAIFVSIILLNISAKLYFILLLPIPILYIIIAYYSKSLNRSTEDLLEKGSRQTSAINEKLVGLEYIQSNSKENLELEKIESIDEDTMNSAFTQSIISRKMIEFIGIYTSIIPILLYIIGGLLFINQGITIGGIMAFSAYINRVYSPFLSVGMMSVTMESIVVSVRRVKALLQEIKPKDESLKGIEINETLTKVKLKGVKFSYNERKEIFKDLNIEINNEKIFSIKGKNGTGKTTIIKMVIGLIDPKEGRILINNYDIKDLDKKALRERISIIDQKTFLFNDTIKNNILYSSTTKNINELEERYKHIVKKLSIDQIFKKHEGNGDLLVGQNGIKLSGGEVQKISVARALMKDADIIIFDEAVVNIDESTKKIIKEIILKEFKNKIVIIIDHTGYFDDIINDFINLNKDY